MRDSEDTSGGKVSNLVETANLPPPFSIPELFVVRIQNANVSSLQKFLHTPIRVHDPDAEHTAQSIKLQELKEKYEAYCFINDYPE